MWSIIAEATCMEICWQMLNDYTLHTCTAAMDVCMCVIWLRLCWCDFPVLMFARVSKLSPDAPYKFLIKFRYRIHTPPRTGMLTHITDIPKYSLVPWACVGFRWPKTYLMKFLRDSFTRQQHPASPRWH